MQRDLTSKDLLVARLLAAGVVVVAPVAKAMAQASANSKSFCLTGTLSQPKAHFRKLIESKGHEYRDAVARGLDYLVMADPSSASKKTEKAMKLGVTCIGEERLLDMLGTGSH